MRTRQTRTHHSVDDPTHKGHPGPCPDSSNAAQVERKGLGGVSAPPGHEMEGPHAGLLLDSLPLPEAIAAASSWLHNPAVAEWMAARAPASDMGSITGGLLDALWPAGTTLMLEGDLGGHLFGGLELQAVGSFGRTPDGRLTAAIQTQAGISFIQAIGLQDEDAFGRTRLDERADAAALLALEVCWDIDGLALGIPRLMAVCMTDDPARELGAACAPIILEAAPDVAVTAGVQATASIADEALEATNLLGPARMLSAPFIDDGIRLQALVGLTNRIEMLGRLRDAWSHWLAGCVGMRRTVYPHAVAASRPGAGGGCAGRGGCEGHRGARCSRLTDRRPSRTDPDEPKRSAPDDRDLDCPLSRRDPDRSASATRR